jgi:hypothetical protein
VDGAFQKIAWKNNQIKTGHKLQSNYLAAYPPSVPLFCSAALHKKELHSVLGCAE